MKYTLQMKIELKTTEDGSHTLYAPSLNEHYHSTNGAIQEAAHVFIDAGLNFCQKTNINIFEIGFGTGLNAFLTLIEAQQKNLTINYTTFELYPISIDVVEKLNFAYLIDSQKHDQFMKLHQTDWEHPHEINNNFILRKLNQDVTNDLFIKNISPCDLIYFDAFGPDKQPEMWSESVFADLYNLCRKDAILVTYSAKGAVRRLLQEVGFYVERIPGPKGKREMIRAIK